MLTETLLVLAVNKRKIKPIDIIPHQNIITYKRQEVRKDVLYWTSVFHHLICDVCFFNNDFRYGLFDANELLKAIDYLVVSNPNGCKFSNLIKFATKSRRLNVYYRVVFGKKMRPILLMTNDLTTSIERSLPFRHPNNIPCKLLRKLIDSFCGTRPLDVTQ